MKRADWYWLNAAVYLLLANLFSQDSYGLISSIAVVSCYALSVGYFLAMVVSAIKGKK